MYAKETVAGACFLALLVILACGDRAEPPGPASPAGTEPAPTEAAVTPLWTDVAPAVGITRPLISGSPHKGFIIEAKGGGIAFVDYDGDGDQDLYVVNGATREMITDPDNAERLTNRLYRNDGDWAFTDVTAEAGVGDSGWGYGCVASDYDNDGDQDIYVANVGPNVLYRNDGDGSFTDVTTSAGVDDERYSTSAAFGDYDEDGDLDLYVTNFVVFRLADVSSKDLGCRYRGLPVMCGPGGFRGYPDSFFRNDGDGTFTDVTLEAGLMEKEPFFGFTPTFEDFDLNGTLDLFVPNDSCPNYLYRNLGNGRFINEGTIAGIAFGEDGRAQASMGVAIGDIDQDGLMDIFLTHWFNDYNALFRNEGSLMFTDRSFKSGVGRSSIAYVSWGTFFFDYDNDADLDLFVANGHTYPVADEMVEGYKQKNMLYLNDSTGQFEEVSDRMGEDFLQAKVSRGAAYADVDNDGDLDIFITELDDPPTFLRNDLDNGNHFLSLRLRGTTSNRDALGSRIELVAGGKRQFWSLRSGGSFLSHHDMRAFFGLGASERADRLKITWPDGKVQEWSDVPADRFIEIIEGDARLHPQRLGKGAS
jgi:hypothetical protein